MKRPRIYLTDSLEERVAPFMKGKNGIDLDFSKAFNLYDEDREQQIAKLKTKVNTQAHTIKRQDQKIARLQDRSYSMPKERKRAPQPQPAIQSSAAPTIETQPQKQWQPVEGYEKNFGMVRADGTKYCPFKDTYDYLRECTETCKVVFPDRYQACIKLHEDRRSQA